MQPLLAAAWNWRSLKARAQLRDRKGRWIDEGKGLFRFMHGGKLRAGNVVGSNSEKNYVIVDVPGQGEVRVNPKSGDFVKVKGRLPGASDSDYASSVLDGSLSPDAAPEFKRLPGYKPELVSQTGDSIFMDDPDGQAHFDALYDYVGAGYDDINPGLRKAAGENPYVPGTREWGLTQAMDDTVASFELSEDTALFRAQNANTAVGDLVQQIMEAGPGFEFTDNGFVSVTIGDKSALSERIADIERLDGDPVIFEIAGKKGLNIADVNALYGAFSESNTYAHEEEGVLGRGTTFRVTDIDIDDNGFTNIKMEILDENSTGVKDGGSQQSMDLGAGGRSDNSPGTQVRTGDRAGDEDGSTLGREVFVESGRSGNNNEVSGKPIESESDAWAVEALTGLDSMTGSDFPDDVFFPDDPIPDNWAGESADTYARKSMLEFNAPDGTALTAIKHKSNTWYIQKSDGTWTQGTDNMVDALRGKARLDTATGELPTTFAGDPAPFDSFNDVPATLKAVKQELPDGWGGYLPEPGESNFPSTVQQLFDDVDNERITEEEAQKIQKESLAEFFQNGELVGLSNLDEASVTPEQSRALERYAKHLFDRINKVLRKPRDEHESEFRDDVAKIRDLIGAASVKEDTSVYRYVPADNMDVINFLDRLETSGFVRDPGFISTTKDKGLFLEELRKQPKRKVGIRIDLPEGSPAIDINQFFAKYDQTEGGILTDHEQEMLIQSGAILKLKKKIRDKSGATVYLTELVATDRTPDVRNRDAKSIEDEPVVIPEGFNTKDAGKAGLFVPLSDPGESGDGWTADGLWGKYGAAGALIRAQGGNGEPVFLMMQNSEGAENNAGLWQLPGGALDANETDYQGAAREISEEIGAPDEWLQQIVAAGSYTDTLDDGWHYTNLVADAPGVFDISGWKTAHSAWELEDVQWLSKADIEMLLDTNQVHPALAKNLRWMMEAGTRDTTTSNPVSIESLLEETPLTFNPKTWIKTAAQAGSNIGGFFEDESTGKEYYVKWPVSTSHAKNEVLADRLYRAAGLQTADMRLIKDGDVVGTVTEVIPVNDTLQERFAEDGSFMDEFYDGYAIDLWLDNYDVVGMEYDNVVEGPDGRPLRIDPGGSLLYTARGKDKQAQGRFTEDITQSERDLIRMPSAREIFSRITEEQKRQSAERLKNLSPEVISKIIDSMALGPQQSRGLKALLLQRRESILNLYGL